MIEINLIGDKVDTRVADYLNRVNYSLIFMILLHLRINSLNFILNYILEFTQAFKFLRIFASYFNELMLNFEDIKYFILANNIAMITVSIIFMAFFHLDNNFILIFIKELDN